MNSNALMYEKMVEQLSNICQTEAVCKACAGKNCLVGYAKYCTAKSNNEKSIHIRDGFTNIPQADIRGGYDEYEVLHMIAYLLYVCHECKEGHTDDCVINIIRSCMEVIEFGEEQKFEGNVFSYLVQLNRVNEEKASIILEKYQLEKEKVKK